jgi:hypothetical protein
MKLKLQLPALIAASALAFFGMSALANTPTPATPAANSQQSKMKTCNADATTKNLTGDDRKAYMKTCLSAAPPAASTKVNSQQLKMKTCNADATAKKLTGDDRKAFMSTCLKGST